MNELNKVGVLFHADDKEGGYVERCEAFDTEAEAVEFAKSNTFEFAKRWVNRLCEDDINIYKKNDGRYYSILSWWDEEFDEWSGDRPDGGDNNPIELFRIEELLKREEDIKNEQTRD